MKERNAMITRAIKIAGLVVSSYLAGMISGTILCEIFSVNDDIFNLGFLVGFFVPILVLISNYIFKKGE
ncbi:hypothetical protein D3Z38_06420 [Clostridiales bacterium]|jgi:hypothetical protein|nr:hypothetical protein [Clostridiales bacterium]